jgi:hypothetical protein
MGFRGGYSQVWLGEGMYAVSFKGNAFTPASTVFEYLYRRAWELCTAAGYVSFVPMDGAAGDRHGVAVIGSQAHVWTKPGRSVVVRCQGRHPAPPRDPDAVLPPEY